MKLENNSFGIGSILVLIASMILVITDAFCIWLGWNQFIHTVTSLPEITYFQAIAAGLMKASVIRGFGLRVRRDTNT